MEIGEKRRVPTSLGQILLTPAQLGYQCQLPRALAMGLLAPTCEARLSDPLYGERGCAELPPCGPIPFAPPTCGPRRSAPPSVLAPDRGESMGIGEAVARRTSSWAPATPSSARINAHRYHRPIVPPTDLANTSSAKINARRCHRPLVPPTGLANTMPCKPNCCHEGNRGCLKLVSGE
jgi:hypothetical protein